MARCLLGDEHAVDDVVQETLLAAVQEGPQRIQHLKGWLRGTVANLARMRFRSEARRGQREARTSLDSSTPSPHEVLEYESLRRQVVDAVLALPESQRQYVLLRFFRDASTREIAALLDQPERTVRHRLQRSLDTLRRELRRDHEDDRAWHSALLVLAYPRRIAQAAPAGLSLSLSAALLWLGGAAGVLWVASVLWVERPLAPSRPAPRSETAELSEPVADAPGPRDTSLPSRELAPAPAAPPEPAAPFIRVAGEIRDPTGQPVRGARVYYVGLPQGMNMMSEPPAVPSSQPAPPSTVSDEQGRFLVRWERAQLLPDLELGIRVEHPSYEPLQHRVLLEDKDLDLVPFVLTARLAVEVLVHDELMRPVEQARFWLSEPREIPQDPAMLRLLGPDARQDLTAEVLGSGRYRLHLTAGREGHGVVVWTRGPATTYGVSDPVLPGGVESPLVIPVTSLSAPTVVRGQTLDVEGKPVPARFLYWSDTSVVGPPSPLGIFSETQLHLHDGTISQRRQHRGTAKMQAGRTGPDGRFEISVETIEPLNFEFHPLDNEELDVRLLHVRPGRPVECRFEPRRPLLVNVLDPQGQPVPDALVYARHSRRESALTCWGATSNELLAAQQWLLERAHFRSIPAAYSRHPYVARGTPQGGPLLLLAPRNDFVLCVEAAGHEAHVSRPFGSGALPESLDVTLAEAPALEGVVEWSGASGAPVRLQLHRAHPNVGATLGGYFPARSHRNHEAVALTRPDGGFRLTIPAAGHYFLRASGPDFPAFDVGPLALDPRRVPDRVTLVPPRAGSLRGRLKLRASAPRAGQWVVASRGDGLFRSVRTDRKGEFAFAELAPGRWWVGPLTTMHPSLTVSEMILRDPYRTPDPDEHFGTHPEDWVVEVASEETAWVELDLTEPCGWLEGRLAWDGDRYDMGLVQLIMNDDHPAYARGEVLTEVELDATGHFHLPVPEPAFHLLRIVLEAGDTTVVMQEILPPSAGPMHWRFDGALAGAVTGTLPDFDAASAPAPATLSVNSWTGVNAAPLQMIPLSFRSRDIAQVDVAPLRLDGMTHERLFYKASDSPRLLTIVATSHVDEDGDFTFEVVPAGTSLLDAAGRFAELTLEPDQDLHLPFLERPVDR